MANADPELREKTEAIETKKGPYVSMQENPSQGGYTVDLTTRDGPV